MQKNEKIDALGQFFMPEMKKLIKKWIDDQFFNFYAKKWKNWLLESIFHACNEKIDKKLIRHSFFQFLCKKMKNSLAISILSP